MENILLPHRQRTIRRMKAQQSVLCIQDGSALDYSSLECCEGLGVIGSNQTGAKSRGLHLHSTLAVATNGLPLGILKAQCMAPGLKSKTDNRPHCDIPIEEKESFCWIQGLRDCMEAAKEIPHTRLISVMDREADFFELFDEQRQNPSVELLVRARHNRSTTEEGKLFDAVRQTEVRAQLRIRVERQSARPKKSKQKARAKRSARTAQASIRYRQVELRPPVYHKDKPPIVLWVVHVVEDNPPEDDVVTDHDENRVRGGCRKVPPLVLPALAYRGLASRIEVRMPRRRRSPQNCRASQTSHRNQLSHCLADHADDPFGQRDSGAFQRNTVLGSRNRGTECLR